MVFDKYGKQMPQKEAPKPSSGVSSSSYLSRLASQAGASAGGNSGMSGSAGFPRATSATGGNSQVWCGTSSGNNVRSSIEKRLHWVETAFKEGSQKQAGGGESVRSVASSIRTRVNALLTYDLPPKIRSELEIIDRELNKII
jgi:hypothetical protein